MPTPRVRGLLAAVLLLAAGAAMADAWRDIPYERFHRALTMVTPLPDARYVRIRQQVSVPETDMKLEDLRIVVAAASGDIEVPIRPDGGLDFPISDALLRENPAVRVNAPDGKLSLSIQLDAEAGWTRGALPPGRAGQSDRARQGRHDHRGGSCRAARDPEQQEMARRRC